MLQLPSYDSAVLLKLRHKATIPLRLFLLFLFEKSLWIVASDQLCRALGPQNKEEKKKETKG